MDYFEKDLEIPFLRVLRENVDGLLMSDIKKALLERLNPTGTCAEPSPTRTGEIKLQQRIGNFTPERKRRIFTMGYVAYDPNTKIYKITESGVALVDASVDVYDSLISQGFSEKEREEEIDKNFTDFIIEEGETREVSQKQRKRSRLLRKLKIEEIKSQTNDKIQCCACGFDFEEKYNGIGSGFIQIHHLKPVHSIGKEGTKESVENALKNVVPLCSNCHSIVHRDRDKMLSITELKEIIKKQEDMH